MRVELHRTAEELSNDPRPGDFLRLTRRRVEQYATGYLVTYDLDVVDESVDSESSRLAAAIRDKILSVTTTVRVNGWTADEWHRERERARWCEALRRGRAA